METEGSVADEESGCMTDMQVAVSDNFKIKRSIEKEWWYEFGSG